MSEDLHIRTGHSWFEGWPILTLVGGSVVIKEGELTGKPGSAKYLRWFYGRKKGNKTGI